MREVSLHSNTDNKLVRRIRTALADNGRWIDFKPRADDIFVCAPPKCGTTWVQTIVVNLLWPAGDAPAPVMKLSPWVEERGRPADTMHAMLESQSHRRILKSHMPADGIPWYGDAKYLFVGRDGRDAFMSWCNHVGRIRALALINERAEREHLSTVTQFEGNYSSFFAEWMSQRDGLLETTSSFWKLRQRGNLLLVHFNDLKSDLRIEMNRIADFLGIHVPAHLWPKIVDRCTFDGMRDRSSEIGNLKLMLAGGMKGFIFKGENGRWRAALGPSDIAAYQRRVADVLQRDAARWLELGRINGNLQL